ncbi:helix-turn-helix protein [Rhodococcus sp. SMB37]|nr:helix-turn-helix protein [Rhodococcus sp. SMB37]
MDRMEPEPRNVVDLGAARAAREPRLLRQVYGEVLRNERRDQDRSLDDVARAVGMSKQYLSEIERGRKDPSSEILGSVCNALGMPVEQLLEQGIRRMSAHRAIGTTQQTTVELRAA